MPANAAEPIHPGDPFHASWFSGSACRFFAARCRKSTQTSLPRERSRLTQPQWFDSSEETAMRISVRDLTAPVTAVVNTHATIAVARDRLLRSNADAVYVVDDAGRLAGIVPDYEFLKAELCGVADTTVAASLASRKLESIDVDADIASVFGRFREARCSRIAVTENGRLVGRVTRTDVLRLVRHLRDVAAVTEVSAGAKLAGPHFHRRRPRLAPVRKISRSTAPTGHRKVRRLSAT
jgi:signal-transduction protein with cAMP-binding, CBS, and nucleotidyltransferase domain